MNRKDNVIGESIVRMRKIHNISQAQLAEIIGKSQSTVCAYESGEVLPPIDVLFIIASAFDSDISGFMGLKSKSLSTADIDYIYDLMMKYYEEK